MITESHRLSGVRQSHSFRVGWRGMALVLSAAISGGVHCAAQVQGKQSPPLSVGARRAVPLPANSAAASGARLSQRLVAYAIDAPRYSRKKTVAATGAL